MVKKTIFATLGFICLFITAFLVLDACFYNHDSGWEATDDWSTVDYVFMGSSHVFCDINPVIINDALGIKTVDLCSSSQPIEITYYNFIYLLSKCNPKGVIIDVSVLNSSIEFLYEKGKKGYIYGAIDGIRNPMLRGKVVMELMKPEDWLEAYSQLARPVSTWERFDHWLEGYKPYHALGFKAREGIVAETLDLSAVEKYYRENQDLKIEGSQESSFNDWLIRLLDMAEEKGIAVYLINSPMGEISSTYVALMRNMRILKDKYTVIKEVKDYNSLLSDIGIHTEDFYDTTHLNRLGATKFSKYLISDMEKWIGREADYDRIGWSGEEYCELLDDYSVRYTVELPEGCLIRFIARDEQGNRIDQKDFSRENTMELPLGYTLSYEISAKYEDSFTYNNPQKMKFMRNIRVER